MNRRHFLWTTGAACCAPLHAAGASPLIVLSAGEVDRIRGNDAMKRNADAALKQGPWTVTSKRPENTTSKANDYYSEGPYWWPDPKNPKGPYIRKDGERYPGRFTANRNDLGQLCTATLALGMGAAFLKRKDIRDHAGKILSTWFVDPKTRMNSNLEFGQAVRGHNEGRGTGLIDTVSFIHCCTGVELLSAAGQLDPALDAGVRKWFSEFLHWMTTSKKGLDEKNSGNNHMTWWTAQVAAYATFTKNAAMQQMAWQHYRARLLGEIEPDGSCPREEARTKSLGYSAMNLDAFATTCRIAQVNGVNLWKEGRLQKAFDYLIPYVVDPSKWKKQQIEKYSNDSVVFPGLAGVGLRNKLLLDSYFKLPRSSSPWVVLIDSIVRDEAAVGGR